MDLTLSDAWGPLLFFPEADFFLQLSTHGPKINKTSMWEVKNIQDFCHGTSNSAILATARCVKEGLNEGGGGGGESTCRLSVKISLLCRLSVKILLLCRLSVKILHLCRLSVNLS